MVLAYDVYPKSTHNSCVVFCMRTGQAGVVEEGGREGW